MNDINITTEVKKWKSEQEEFHEDDKNKWILLYANATSAISFILLDLKYEFPEAFEKCIRTLISVKP